MKILDLKKTSLKKLIKAASKETVVLTEDEKPAFIIARVREEDLQTWMLGENPDFLDIMRQSYQRMNQEGLVSLDEARTRLIE